MEEVTAINQSPNDQGALWRVWRTADSLEKDGLPPCRTQTPTDGDTRELTQKVVSILRRWAETWAGEKLWKSFLNKPSLLHEVEESIIALNLLLKWMNTSNQEFPVTIVDVCSGKGYFSMIASYIFQDDDRVAKIVMLDKAVINWNHVVVANYTASEDKRPMIEAWSNCNLHDTDQVVDRLQDLKYPLALIGIHLCKMLSPACIGIVNALGPSLCPFLCLAPCCLPRVVTKKLNRRGNAVIEVPQYETHQEREDRLTSNRRRTRMSKKLAVFACHRCQSSEHPIQKCPLLPTDENERAAILVSAAAAFPCWKCGIIGHFRVDCPSELISVKPSRVTPPLFRMEVSKVLESEKPFHTYCGLLTDTLQRDQVRLMDTGLVNGTAPPQERNWNSERKAIYIVATR